MYIKYSDLCSCECVLDDIISYRMDTKHSSLIYDYQTSGRSKHLIFYQLENKRSYYIEKTHICTLEKGDILFLPHGAKYRSFIENSSLPSGGIGVSFNLIGADGERIFFDEEIKLIMHDHDGVHYKQFKKIFYSVMNPVNNGLRLRGDLYTLLDNMFSSYRRSRDFEESFGDIKAAINILENSPEKNLSVADLADICHMSESSFLRKFKDYSGGISPMKYRNNIRIIMAEELSTSPLTVTEIAERLGYYDAAHLCKSYKQKKGRTLKI